MLNAKWEYAADTHGSTNRELRMKKAEKNLSSLVPSRRTITKLTTVPNNKSEHPNGAIKSLE